MILEFGSGCSTVLLAQALLDNATESGEQGGFLYSLDVDEEWAQVTRSSMPERLKDFYEIRHAPVEIVNHRGTRVFRHQNVPELDIDMIYLDGPPLTPEIRVAIDPIDLEGLMRSEFVLCVDGRKENVRYLKQHLRRRYRIRANRIRNNPTFYLLD